MSTMDLSTCAKRCFGKQGCGLTFGVTSALVEQISPAASDASLKATRFPSLLALFFMIVVVILRSSVGVVFVVALVVLVVFVVGLFVVSNLDLESSLSQPNVLRLFCRHFAVDAYGTD